jgi:ribonuclease D
MHIAVLKNAESTEALEKMREMVQTETEKVRKALIGEAMSASEALKNSRTPEERTANQKKCTEVIKKANREMANAAEKVKASKEYIALKKQCEEYGTKAFRRQQFIQIETEEKPKSKE